jgi:hypothetical protein
MRKKENHANKKMEVIITGYHVFGADIKKMVLRLYLDLPIKMAACRWDE